MAIALIRAQVIGRSSGRSSVAAAAYRAATRLTDVRTGQAHDYTRKQGVRDAIILAPASAPDWMKDRAQLWNGVERAEDELNRKRNAAQLARELVIALPHELPHDARRALVTKFVQEEFVSKGMVADLVLHAPSRDGDDRNEHAHLMLTMREILGDSFGEKVKAWNSSALLEKWKESWAQRVNAALAAHGLSARIDHRSHEEQAADEGHDIALANIATLHMGPAVSRMERNGFRTEIGDLNREIKIVNLELERARREAREETEKANSRTLPASRLPEPRIERLRLELQEVLGLSTLPTAAEAGETIRRRRDAVGNGESHVRCLREDKRLQEARRHEDEARGAVRRLTAQLTALQAQGHDLNTKIRDLRKQSEDAKKWRKHHPLRAKLHDLGLWKSAAATGASDHDQLRLREQWMKAAAEDRELRARLAAARDEQEVARQDYWSERQRVEREVQQEAAEEAQRLERAEMLATDLASEENEELAHGMSETKTDPTPALGTVQIRLPSRRSAAAAHRPDFDL